MLEELELAAENSRYGRIAERNDVPRSHLKGLVCDISVPRTAL